MQHVIIKEVGNWKSYTNLVIDIGNLLCDVTCNDHVTQEAEEFLVHVIDLGGKFRNFDELRVHQFRYMKSSSHKNIPPTTQDLKPHILQCMFWTGSSTWKQQI